MLLNAFFTLQICRKDLDCPNIILKICYVFCIFNLQFAMLDLKDVGYYEIYIFCIEEIFFDCKRLGYKNITVR